jgi:hypothetical protein
MAAQAREIKRSRDRYEIPVELPVPSDDSGQEVLVGAGGLPVHLVVGAHDAGHIAVHHAALERRLECVVQVLLRHLNSQNEKIVTACFFLALCTHIFFLLIIQLSVFYTAFSFLYSFQFTEVWIFRKFWHVASPTMMQE